MESADGLRDRLGAAVGGAAGSSSADRLCRACVELLDVDGAAISLIHAGSAPGTLGSSGEVSRRIDQLQFTLAEGPCLDSVRQEAPVLVPDFEAAAARRWPAFAGAADGLGIRALFALPIAVASSWIGALDLFRTTPGPLSPGGLAGGRWAADLAALPLLDLMTTGAELPDAGQRAGGWEQLASLERVEVYQATGMIMGQLGVDSAEALVRLRAYAFAHDRSPSDVAWDVVERRLALDVDGSRNDAGPGQGLSS